MTFVQIRNLVRSLLNDPSPGYFDESLISDSVRAANWRINKTLIHLQPRRLFLYFAYKNIQIGENFHDVPIDVDVLHRVELVLEEDNSVLDRILEPLPFPDGKFKHYDTATQNSLSTLTPGKPTHFLWRRQTLELFPVPDAAYTIRIWYDLRQAALSLDTDVPAVEPDFHYHIAQYAAYLTSLRNPVEVRIDLKDSYMEAENLLISSLTLGIDQETETPVGMFGF